MPNARVHYCVAALCEAPHAGALFAKSRNTLENQARQPIPTHAQAPTKNKHLAATSAGALGKYFMNDILTKSMVLVLNRNWQAVNVRTPQEAFCMMATNVATGLDIEGESQIRPVTWDEWIALPIRPQDNAVKTMRGPIRVPTVIVAVNYAKVPKKRPKLCARAIRERDGNRCQYTGRVLRPDKGSLDHVLPRSRGGRDA